MTETAANGVQALDRQMSDSLPVPERRVVVKDPNDIPNDYSTTPGGTIFSTTPGGTRIIYDRRFLLHMRNSPLAKTPPAKLASIPDILNEDEEKPAEETKSPEPAHPHREDHPESSEMFSMDIEHDH